MADITTGLVYEHEIAKAEDFIFAWQSVIRNTALLDRMLVSAESDYIVGGRVIIEGGSMNFHIEPIWANGRTVDIPVYCDHNSDMQTVTPAVNNVRVDTVQVRGVMSDYDMERRAFFNPDTEAGQYFTVNTKTRLAVECMVKEGVEGDEYAPVADEGWVKIAEIVVLPGESALDQSNIKNVTAIYQNEENTFWTNQKYRTFSLGSQNEMKVMFGLEHNADGTHRASVIKAANILLGAGAGALNASVISLGIDIAAGDINFLAAQFVTAAIQSLGAALKTHADSIFPHEATPTPTPSRIAMFTAQGRLKSGMEPAAEDDVVRKAEADALNVKIQENTGMITTLWNAVFMNITENPFEITFENLNGIIMEYGVWNELLARVECSDAYENPFILLFAALDGINVEYGVWNEPSARVEC